MSHRSFLRVVSIFFAALMALSAIFINRPGGYGIFVLVCTLCLLAVWIFTILRCFRKQGILPSDREFEIVVLASIAVLLLNWNFSNGFGIASFIVEAAAAAYLIVMLIRDRRRGR